MLTNQSKPVGTKVIHATRGIGVVKHAGVTISLVWFPKRFKKLACWNADLMSVA